LKPARDVPEQLQQETENAFKRFYSFRHAWQNVAVTGWGSSLYRLMGWWLVRRFEQKNRWYLPVPGAFPGRRLPGENGVEPELRIFAPPPEEGTKKPCVPACSKFT